LKRRALPRRPDPKIPRATGGFGQELNYGTVSKDVNTPF
jgi:hypothetical protein